MLTAIELIMAILEAVSRRDYEKLFRTVNRYADELQLDGDTESAELPRNAAQVAASSQEWDRVALLERGE